MKDNMVENLRALSRDPNGATQKFLIQQALAGIADLMDMGSALNDRQNDADLERTKIRELQKHQGKVLANYGKGIWVIGSGFLLWLLNSILGLL